MCLRIVCFLFIVVAIEKAITYKLIDYNNRLSNYGFSDVNDLRSYNSYDRSDTDNFNQHSIESYGVGIYFKRLELFFEFVKKMNSMCSSVSENG